MALTFDQLEQEALALPNEQRAELAKHLWETLDATPEPEISDAWRVEVRQRLEELNSGKVTPIPGEDVMRRLIERFAK